MHAQAGGSDSLAVAGTAARQPGRCTHVLDRLEGVTTNLCRDALALSHPRIVAIKLHTLLDRGSVLCDQTGVLTVLYSSKDYPAALPRVVVKDETGRRVTFLTNNFALKPEFICQLYRQCWQIELFFKWLKQHLRIKPLLGTSENAVKTQIWIAVCTYVLIAIVKKRLNFPPSLYEILQILSLTMFETTLINQLLTPPSINPDSSFDPQQLVLL